MCAMRWLNLGERWFVRMRIVHRKKGKKIDMLMRRDGGPSTKPRRGASDWAPETRHAAGE